MSVAGGLRVAAICVAAIVLIAVPDGVAASRPVQAGIKTLGQEPPGCSRGGCVPCTDPNYAEIPIDAPRVRLTSGTRRRLGAIVRRSRKPLRFAAAVTPMHDINAVRLLVDGKDVALAGSGRLRPERTSTITARIPLHGRSSPLSSASRHVAELVVVDQRGIGSDTVYRFRTSARAPANAAAAAAAEDDDAALKISPSIKEGAEITVTLTKDPKTGLCTGVWKLPLEMVNTKLGAKCYATVQMSLPNGKAHLGTLPYAGYKDPNEAERYWLHGGINEGKTELQVPVNPLKAGVPGAEPKAGGLSAADQKTLANGVKVTITVTTTKCTDDNGKTTVYKPPLVDKRTVTLKT